MLSSEEIALRHALDTQLARIDGLLERVPPIEVADDTELLVAGALVDRVAEELSALEATARSLEALAGCTVNALELAASCHIAVEAARVAITLTKAMIDHRAAA